MKISVSGKDVTDEVVENLKNVADMRDGAQACESLKQAGEVTGLAEAGDQAEFAGRHLELLRHSCYVDNERFSFSKGSAGVAGVMVRKICWKILRPVFDWISHKQNNINAQIVHAMELEKKVRDSQIARLEKEIKELKNDRR